MPGSDGIAVSSNAFCTGPSLVVPCFPMIQLNRPRSWLRSGTMGELRFPRPLLHLRLCPLVRLRPLVQQMTEHRSLADNPPPPARTSRGRQRLSEQRPNAWLARFAPAGNSSAT
jgi:hypothetical protein